MLICRRACAVMFRAHNEKDSALCAPIGSGLIAASGSRSRERRIRRFDRNVIYSAAPRKRHFHADKCFRDAIDNCQAFALIIDRQFDTYLFQLMPTSFQIAPFSLSHFHFSFTAKRHNKMQNASQFRIGNKRLRLN